MVDDFVCELFELCPVLFQEERLWEPGKRGSGFEDDKVVDVSVELVEADFKPVQLAVNHEQVVDFARLRIDGIPVVFLAMSSDICGSQKPAGFEISYIS